MIKPSIIKGHSFLLPFRPLFHVLKKALEVIRALEVLSIVLVSSCHFFTLQPSIIVSLNSKARKIANRRTIFIVFLNLRH